MASWSPTPLADLLLGTVGRGAVSDLTGSGDSGHTAHVHESDRLSIACLIPRLVVALPAELRDLGDQDGLGLPVVMGGMTGQAS